MISVIMIFMKLINNTGLDISKIPMSKMHEVAQESVNSLTSNLTSVENTVIYLLHNNILVNTLEFYELSAKKVSDKNAENISKMTELLSYINRNITQRASTTNLVASTVLGDVYKQLFSIGETYMNEIDAAITKWVGYRTNIHQGLFSTVKFLNIKLSNNSDIIDNNTLINLDSASTNYFSDVRNHVRGMSIVQNFIKLLYISMDTMKLLLNVINADLNAGNPFHAPIKEMINVFIKNYSEENLKIYTNALLANAANSNNSIVNDQMYGYKNLQVTSIISFIRIIEKFVSLV